MKNTSLLRSFMNSFFVLAMSCFVLGFSGSHAHADNHSHKKPVDILPPVTAADEANMGMPKKTTHPIVRLTPDKSELIRLEGEAGSIIIGNPLHINVIADSSSLIVVVPRSPGATHFTVLSKKGEVLMQRHVIVASPKEDYIRVKKTCLDDSPGCQKTSVYYCPDMCHEIGLEQNTDKGSSDKSDAKDDGGGDNNSNSSANDAPAEE